MSSMAPQKEFTVIVLISIKPFIEIFHSQGNSMYVLPDCGLQTEIFT